jgi:hypothetical protein
LRDGIADDVALLIRGILQKFLAEIVAEGIYERGEPSTKHMVAGRAYRS